MLDSFCRRPHLDYDAVTESRQTVRQLTFAEIGKLSAQLRGHFGPGDAHAMSGLGLRRIEATNNLGVAIAVLLFFWTQCKTKTA